MGLKKLVAIMSRWPLPLLKLRIIVSMRLETVIVASALLLTIAGQLNLPEELFAKMATLFLVCRVVYPFFYALDLDLLRTTTWLIGMHISMMISFASLFPGTILPMLGS